MRESFLFASVLSQEICLSEGNLSFARDSFAGDASREGNVFFAFVLSQGICLGEEACFLHGILSHGICLGRIAFLFCICSLAKDLFSVGSIFLHGILSQGICFLVREAFFLQGI